MVYAPTELSSTVDKDNFYNQLEPIIHSTPPHDQLLVIGDLNAVSGRERAGYERVVGNFGSGRPNDNSARLLNMCSLTNLSIVGSFFRRKEIHQMSWLSNDGHTRKELDHMLTRDCSIFCTYRVPSDWRNGVIISLYKGKDQKKNNATATDL